MRKCVYASTILAAIAMGLGCGKPQNPRIIHPSSPPPDWDARRQAEQSAGGSWRFDDAPTGGLPSGWRIAETQSAGTPATWRVVADPSAPSPPNVLAITETRNTGGTYNLAILEDTAFADLDLSVKVRAGGGKEDQGGGPIWRCRDAGNYYICRWNPLENNFRVYKVIDGRRRQLATADTDAAADAWHTIRVTMRGRHIACYLDGAKLLEADDDALASAGKVGLWTKADAASAFDDLVVQGLD
ncbi:MAG: hypothetical protein HRF43_06085, partial [Phycisphaerae bacterium]